MSFTMSLKTDKWAVRLAAVVLLSLVSAGSVQAQFGTSDEDPLIDWPTRIDPELPVEVSVRTFDERLGSMWFGALNQIDSSTRFEAANAIAKAADMGMTGLEMMVPRLVSMLGDDKEHDLTRVAAARALIAMNANAHAAELWKADVPAARNMVHLIDPALARWQYEPAIKGWRKRLADNSESLAVRLSAVYALALAKDVTGANALTAIAMDSTQVTSLRLAAAQAYGSYMTLDQSKQAVLLPPKAGFIDKLILAHLLKAHQGQAAQKQLARLADDVEPAVAVVAAAHLLAIEPSLLDAMLEKYSKSGDVKLRVVALERYAQRKEAASAEALKVFLDDADPTIRTLARDRLMTLSKEDGLRQAVVARLLESLNGSSVKAQEQAALAVGEIDVKESLPRLLELITSEDAVVALSAATSIRKIQVEASLAPALAYVRQNVSLDTPRDRHGVAAQLIQLMGIMKYAPAQDTFMKLVPKNSGPSAQRSAAVWALGKIYEGQPDKALTRQLVSRANDGQGMNPEDQTVREQAVIALGRMQDKALLKSYQKWINDEQDTTLAIASRWAIGQATGARPPEPEPSAANITGWFLEPAGR